MRHLLHGGDPDAERVYRWHIEKRSGLRMALGLATDAWKTSVDDYMKAAAALFTDMRDFGFRQDCPVPVDPDGELLGGAHRVASALALGINAVPVQHATRKVWAPAWGRAWFEQNGMSENDLARVEHDFEAMRSG